MVGNNNNVEALTPVFVETRAVYNYNLSLFYIACRNVIKMAALVFKRKRF